MLTKGVFLSDIHMPDNIPLGPVFDFLKDFNPHMVVLGGDIIDAKGLHGAAHMQASQVKMEWFRRDVALAMGFVADIKRVCSTTPYVVYLAGNHEQRYDRLRANFPDLFVDSLDFQARVESCVDKYIPYGAAGSYYKIGDCVFTHGDIYPESHAKPYALRYTPYKVVYGHLHHFQAYTAHRALLHESPRFAITAGCLSTTNPEWKQGKANQWVNGFVSFVTDGKTTTPSVHIIDGGRFLAGNKIYGKGA